MYVISSVGLDELSYLEKVVARELSIITKRYKKRVETTRRLYLAIAIPGFIVLSSQLLNLFPSSNLMMKLRRNYFNYILVYSALFSTLFSFVFHQLSTDLTRFTLQQLAKIGITEVKYLPRIHTRLIYYSTETTLISLALIALTTAIITFAIDHEHHYKMQLIDHYSDEIRERFFDGEI